MPDLVVSNEGEVELLRLSNKATGVTTRGWELRLYQNDYSPTKSVTLELLTQSTFPGYVPFPLIDDDWQTPTMSLGQAVTQYGTGPVEFTPTEDTGQAVWGFYVTFNGGESLLFAQRLESPFVPTPLEPVQLLVRFAGRSQSEPDP